MAVSMNGVLGELGELDLLAASLREQAQGVVTELGRITATARVDAEPAVAALCRLLRAVENARYSLQSVAVNRRNVEFTSFFDGLLGASCILCGAAGFTLQTRLPDAPVRASADPAALRVAALNLIANACRHAGREKLRAELSARDGEIRFTVADDGDGIAPGVERLLDGEQDPKGRGLKAVERIAAAHGGHFRLIAGRGTAAVLTLPLATDRLAPPYEAPRAEDYLCDRYSGAYIGLSDLRRSRV